MASLSPGVLLRLLQDSEPSSSGSFPRRPLHAPAAVLQITGIVPATAGPDFSPDQGFYLKVSDSSHSTFVALSADLNDLILADRLQIGQLINVRRLEPASPVPLLHDFRLLSGRHPCHHDTVDLVAGASPASASPLQSSLMPASSATTPPLPPPEKKKRQLHSRSYSSVGERSSSTTEAALSSPTFGTPPRSATRKKRDVKRRGSDLLSELKKIESSVDEEFSDSDDSRFSYISSPSSSRFSCASSYASSPSRFSYSSSSSFLSSPSRPRKNWDSAVKIAEKRKEMKPTAPSPTVSPNRLTPKDDAPGALSAFRRNNEKDFKVLAANSVKRKLPDSDKACTEISPMAVEKPFCSSDSMKCPDKMGIIWALLPQNMMKHGKEVLRQRDLALQAAVDALLEASAAEKLIECLSMYSELQSDKDGDPQHVVNRFLNFHHKLAQTRLIAQSLSKSSQLSSCNCNPTSSSSSSSSVRSVAKVASERKGCAASWVKAALESDLSQLPNQLKIAAPAATEETTSNGSIILSSAAFKPKNALPKGSNLLLASNALQYEYNRCFLRYIEKFLDSVESEAGYNACELEVASLLCQLKRVDDWLNNITSKEMGWPRDRIKESMLSEDDETEACERVRRKIYSILLRHVESAAIALESMNTPDEQKDSDDLMLTS